MVSALRCAARNHAHPLRHPELGKQHLGNYYGAIRQFVAMQDQGEALYFIANLHALTTVRDPEAARTLTRETAMAFLALGLDPARAILFRQSDIPEISELYWILGTVVPLSNLDRAHSYKDKVARGIPADFGLFAYPVLMAADILLYGSDVVPVGRTRSSTSSSRATGPTKFNVQYVPGYDPMPIPPERRPAARASSAPRGAGAGVHRGDPRHRRAEDVEVVRQHHRPLRPTTRRSRSGSWASRPTARRWRPRSRSMPRCTELLR